MRTQGLLSLSKQAFPNCALLLLIPTKSKKKGEELAIGTHTPCTSSKYLTTKAEMLPKNSKGSCKMVRSVQVSRLGILCEGQTAANLFNKEIQK